MGEMAGGARMSGPARMDPAMLRRARNGVVGRLAFNGGKPVRESFPATRLVLEMLDLDWKKPPQDMVVIGAVEHPDPVAVDTGNLRS